MRSACPFWCPTDDKGRLFICDNNDGPKPTRNLHDTREPRSRLQRDLVRLIAKSMTHITGLVVPGASEMVDL